MLRFETHKLLGLRAEGGVYHQAVAEDPHIRADLEVFDGHARLLLHHLDQLAHYLVHAYRSGDALHETHLLEAH